jgi:hypothetical protein
VLRSTQAGLAITFLLQLIPSYFFGELAATYLPWHHLQQLQFIVGATATRIQWRVESLTSFAVILAYALATLAVGCAAISRQDISGTTST